MTQSEIDAAIMLALAGAYPELGVSGSPSRGELAIWNAASDACARACEHQGHERTRNGRTGFNAAMDCADTCRALKATPDKAGT